jgi:hypothetical protein
MGVPGQQLYTVPVPASADATHSRSRSSNARSRWPSGWPVTVKPASRRAMRHSFATHLAGRLATISAPSRNAGPATATTMIYTHVLNRGGSRRPQPLDLLPRWRGAVLRRRLSRATETRRRTRLRAGSRASARVKPGYDSGPWPVVIILQIYAPPGLRLRHPMCLLTRSLPIVPAPRPASSIQRRYTASLLVLLRTRGMGVTLTSRNR